MPRQGSTASATGMSVGRPLGSRGGVGRYLIHEVFDRFPPSGWRPAAGSGRRPGRAAHSAPGATLWSGATLPKTGLGWCRFLTADRVGAPSIIWIVTTSGGDRRGAERAIPMRPRRRLARAGPERGEPPAGHPPHPLGPFAPGRDADRPVPAERGGRLRSAAVSARTVAHEMQARGYQTAYFGKWHLAERDRQAPLGRGACATGGPEGGPRRICFLGRLRGRFLLNGPWLHGTRLPVRPDLSYQSEVVLQRAGLAIGAGRPRLRGCQC